MSYLHYLVQSQHSYLGRQRVVIENYIPCEIVYFQLRMQWLCNSLDHNFCCWLSYLENNSFVKFVSILGGWMLKIWKMKVFRIRQSIAHFDQWKPMISKINVMRNKIHLLDFEPAEVMRPFLRSPSQTFKIIWLQEFSLKFLLFFFNRISKIMTDNLKKN